MNRFSFFVIVSAFITLAGAIANAQEVRQRSERVFGFGLGFGTGRMSVGDKTNSNFGISLLGRVGIDSRNRFLLVAEINPLEVESPVLDESFRAFNILLSLNLGKSFKVRPTLGFQRRSWSGEERVTDTEIDIVLGIDVGYEFRRTENFSLSPEVVYRWTIIEFEGSVTSGFIGLQIVGSWKM